jgi:outer membrane protein assembly factor BamB
MLAQILLHWLDFFYDLPVIAYIALLVGWIIGLHYIADWVKGWWFGVLLLLVGIGAPIGLIFMKSTLGLGYLHNSVPYVGVLNKYLALSDHYHTYSKTGSRFDHHRLYLIDLQQGKVMFRTPVKSKVHSLAWDNGKILLGGVKGKRVFSLDGNAESTFSTPDLKDLPELKSGIYKQGYNAKTNQVWVINKKGEEFFYNAQTLQREPKNVSKSVATGGVLFQQMTSLPKTKYRALEHKKRYDKRAYCAASFYGNYRSNIRQRLHLAAQPTNKYFVYGKLMYCLPEQRLALISSYETTDKKKLLITALDTQTGKTLWELTPKQLGLGDHKVSLHYFIPLNNGKEGVLLGGQYLARFNTKTGKVVWSRRL